MYDLEKKAYFDDPRGSNVLLPMCILLSWCSDHIEATNLVQKEYSLTMGIKVKSTSSTFQKTTVYGPTDEGDKPRFLEEMITLKPALDTPRLVLGDFNLIYSASHKNNLNLNRLLMGRFRQALNRCELSEFCLQNHKFTCCNEREQPTLVRLDRVFRNKEWELLFTDFSLQALSSSLSDHCPLFFAQQHRPTIRGSFRFENFWPRVPGFLDVIMGAWQAAVLGISLLYLLFYKL
jgi:hypothetical protein